MTSDDSNHDGAISDPGRQACVNVVTVEPALLSAAGWLRLGDQHGPSLTMSAFRTTDICEGCYDVRSGRQQQTLFVIWTQI
jgi:hypothetical protein